MEGVEEIIRKISVNILTMIDILVTLNHRCFSGDTFIF